MVAERFARQLAVLAGPSGGLSGQHGVGGCEMTHANELKGRDAFGVGELRQLALHPITVGEQPLADMILACLAQILERRRPLAALGQAVAAVAKGVRARRKTPVALVALRSLGRGAVGIA